MKLRMFEIVSDKDKIDINKIVEILEARSAINDYAYILHDKDDTREHYHITARLKDSYDSKYIADWFGIPENFIEKVKGRWSDMLKYLIHENAPGKYQYQENEVISNFDWKREKDKLTSEQRKHEIINNIVNGTIREYNYFNSITAIENDKYYKSIQNAFKYRLDIIKGVSRSMDCIFITGESGVGKTSYAKHIAENKGYSVYVSSASNDILDDYKGQDCIILDDLRPSSIGLSDLLKMLDNHTASTVKSRYRNKVLECRLVIITTILDIDTFFKNVFKDDDETSIQLKRRCETHIRMDYKNVYAKLWMKKSKQYGDEFVTINPITAVHQFEDMSETEQLERLSSMLGEFQNIVNDVKKNIGEYTVKDKSTQLKIDDGFPAEWLPKDKK